MRKWEKLEFEELNDEEKITYKGSVKEYMTTLMDLAGIAYASQGKSKSGNIKNPIERSWNRISDKSVVKEPIRQMMNYELSLFEVERLFRRTRDLLF